MGTAFCLGENAAGQSLWLTVAHAFENVPNHQLVGSVELDIQGNWQRGDCLGRTVPAKRCLGFGRCETFYTSEHPDLAVIALTGDVRESVQSLPVSSAPFGAGPVTCYGFPFGKEFQGVAGQVDRIDSAGRGIGRWVSVVGMSGGPVINTTQQVVGIQWGYDPARRESLFTPGHVAIAWLQQHGFTGLKPIPAPYVRQEPSDEFPFPTERFPATIPPRPEPPVFTPVNPLPAEPAPTIPLPPAVTPPVVSVSEPPPTLTQPRKHSLWGFTLTTTALVALAVATGGIGGVAAVPVLGKLWTAIRIGRTVTHLARVQGSETREQGPGNAVSAPPISRPIAGPSPIIHQQVVEVEKDTWRRAILYALRQSAMRYPDRSGVFTYLEQQVNQFMGQQLVQHPEEAWSSS